MPTILHLSGSPYAITAYQCNPELGGNSALESLREVMKSESIALMLDFVPNHMAGDCPQVVSNPEMFVRAPRHLEAPFSPDRYLPNGVAYGNPEWTDTAQINYWNPVAVDWQIENLLQVASFCSAIRCDMAHLVLNDNFGAIWRENVESWGWQRPEEEFWRVAIRRVKEEYPGTIFLAETYSDESTLLSLGFDFVYDKRLFDRLEHGNLDSIRDHISMSGSDFLSRCAHFVENHDEPRAVHSFGSVERANAAAVITFTVPGMRFHFQGQWKGKRAKLNVHLRRCSEEPISEEAVEFYQRLQPIVSEDVFRRGSFAMANIIQSPPEESAWRLLAWQWSLADKKEYRLVVVNFTDTLGVSRYAIPCLDEVEGEVVVVSDLLSGQKWERQRDVLLQEGLVVVLEPWKAQIFAFWTE